MVAAVSCHVDHQLAVAHVVVVLVVEQVSHLFEVDVADHLRLTVTGVPGKRPDPDGLPLGGCPLLGCPLVGCPFHGGVLLGRLLCPRDQVWLDPHEVADPHRAHRRGPFVAAEVMHRLDQRVGDVRVLVLGEALNPVLRAHLAQRVGDHPERLVGERDPQERLRHPVAKCPQVGNRNSGEQALDVVVELLDERIPVPGQLGG